MHWTDMVIAVAAIAQAMALIGSLAFIYCELRDNTRAVKSATYQSVINARADLEGRLSHDLGSIHTYRVGREAPDELNQDDLLRFNQIISSLFNLYENLYFQYQSGLLNRELWSGWCRNLFLDDFLHPGVQAWWKEKNHLYSKRFRDFVNEGKYTED